MYGHSMKTPKQGAQIPSTRPTREVSCAKWLEVRARWGDALAKRARVGNIVAFVDLDYDVIFRIAWYQPPLL